MVTCGTGNEGQMTPGTDREQKDGHRGAGSLNARDTGVLARIFPEPV